MIARILTEGQWELPDDAMDGLNELDAQVEDAIGAGDEERFAAALGALLDAVRSAGSPLADDSLEDSDVILPPADAAIDEVRAMLADDGLLPG